MNQITEASNLASLSTLELKNGYRGVSKSRHDTSFISLKSGASWRIAAKIYLTSATACCRICRLLQMSRSNQALW